MEHCPICESFKSESHSLCGCGYNFERNEITDSYKIHEYLINKKCKGLERRCKINKTYL